MVLILSCGVSCASCEKTNGNGTPDTSDPDIITHEEPATQNLLRAMQITDKAIESYFNQTTMAMTEFYNPFTGSSSSGTVDVWPYTSAIEAVNAIMHALSAQKEAGDATLYDENFSRYAELLGKLYKGLQYYEGSFELISYTQTRNWSVYSVHRSDIPGSAAVAGIDNVYDDQQWIIRELLEAYKLTGNKEYLEKAEYLTDYVIDGWDCTLAPDGTENGGITWGPGYTTKHSCSNGPFVSPLVWLSEIYAGSGETATYRYIDSSKKRLTKEMDKSEYYMMYAKKVYDFQKTHLMDQANGVYYDMLGGPSGMNDTNIDKMDDASKAKVYETVDGIKYKAYLEPGGPNGTPLSYNSGTMLSGAADLYRATKDDSYRQDMEKLTDACFKYFAKLDADIPGLYSYAYDGFNNWFNGVMLRGWVNVFEESGYKGTHDPIKSFQDNLDYGYTSHVKDGILPGNLYLGWPKSESSCTVKGFFQFAFAAEYAVLAKYMIEQ